MLVLPVLVLVLVLVCASLASSLGPTFTDEADELLFGLAQSNIASSSFDRVWYEIG